jgi:hypothetical protein
MEDKEDKVLKEMEHQKNLKYLEWLRNFCADSEGIEERNVNQSRAFFQGMDLAPKKKKDK